MIPYKSQGSVEGNAEVIALLERWIARVKFGQINYAAITLCEGPLHLYHDYAGMPGMEFAANWGLDMLKHRIMTENTNRKPPETDKSAPADRFVWLATSGPACFDFFAWLIMAEMARLREKAPGPLRVGFYAGEDNNLERAVHTAGRWQMYNNVIKPALAFVGAIEDPTCIKHGRVMERYTFVDIVRACVLGEDVPVLRPTPAAVAAVAAIGGKGPYITITLREAAYSAHRNSDFDEWLKFAEYLEAQGERIIFVRDTSCATEAIAGYETCPAASVDIDVRLALYEGAKCNLFVSNGPWSLALFGTRPWLMFNQVDAMDPYPPNTNQWWTQFHGISKGQQFPWSRPDQRIVWQRDTFAVMCKAWEELAPLFEIRQAAE